ncbi:MAG: hypothetical protein IPH98_19720 [Saprospiraceae bacterium]|nr:hypothetical protein [Candidatus Defluviibacterium haderslevense]
MLKPNRVTQNVNVCFDDTSRIAGIKLYAGKLIDSATLKNANQCDSTIVFNGTLVGYRCLTQNHLLEQQPYHWKIRPLIKTKLKAFQKCLAGLAFWSL